MPRLSGLDLLRAIAIVWVMLFHSYIVGGIGERYALVQESGWMGVDLFFVLSGFLIGSQLLRPLSRGEPLRFGDFYLRRALRILPAFWVVLLLYFAWPAFREASGIQPAWQFLTFTVNLLIDYPRNKAFSHAWSLCVEEHFYLLFPWLAWWLTRRPSVAKFIGACVGVVIIGMAIRGYAWLHAMAPLRDIDESGFNTHFIEDIYYPTWARLDGLLAGVVLAVVKVYRPALWLRWQTRANGLLLAGLIVTGAAIVLFQDRTGLIPSVLGYPLLAFAFALLVAAGASAQGWLDRIRVPGASWLALVSYSLYLSHKAVFHLLHTTWPQLHGVAAFGAQVLATLAAAALLHYLIERPFLRWRGRLLDRVPSTLLAEDSSL